MDKNIIHILLTTVYAVAFVFLAISVGDIILGYSVLQQYDFTYIRNYGEPIDDSVIKRIVNLFSIDMTYVLICFGLILGLLFAFSLIKFLWKKETKAKRLTNFVMGTAISAIIIVFLVLIVVDFSQYTAYFPLSYAAYSHPNNFSIYNFEYAVKARSSFVIPLITMILMVCVNIYFSIMTLVKSTKENNSKIEGV